MSQVFESELVDLNTALAYQPEGIVSRIVLKQPSGSMTMFAFDAGQELSEHTCPYEALLHVVDGEAVVTIDGAPHDVASGQMIKLPAGVPHAVQARQRFKMVLTMFRALAGSDERYVLRSGTAIS